MKMGLRLRLRVLRPYLPMLVAEGAFGPQTHQIPKVHPPRLFGGVHLPGSGARYLNAVLCPID